MEGLPRSDVSRFDEPLGKLANDLGWNPERAERLKVARLFRLNAFYVPLLRLLGFIFVAVFVGLLDMLVSRQHSPMSIGIFAAVLIAYSPGSWAP